MDWLTWLFNMLREAIGGYSLSVPVAVGLGLSFAVVIIRTYWLPHVTGKMALYLTAAVTLFGALVTAVGDAKLTGREFVDALELAIRLVIPAGGGAMFVYWLLGLLRKHKAAKVGA